MKKIFSFIMVVFINGFTFAKEPHITYMNHYHNCSYLSVLQGTNHAIVDEKTTRYYVGLSGSRFHAFFSGVSIVSNIESQGSFMIPNIFLSIIHLYFSWEADKAWREKYKQPNYNPSKLHAALYAIFAPIYGFFHWLGDE